MLLTPKLVGHSDKMSILITKYASTVFFRFFLGDTFLFDSCNYIHVSEQESGHDIVVFPVTTLLDVAHYAITAM